MNTQDTAFAYQQSTASAASSVGQVVALYDRILRDLRSTIAAIGAGQIENRVNCLNHALTIIGELQGVLDFQRGVEDVRKIRGPVEEMAPVMAHSSELVRMQPEVAGQLDLYKSQLGDLQTTLGQIRVMLLARQASLEAGRAQLSAVSQWMGAFRQTR